MFSVDLGRVRDFIQIVEMGNITRASEASGERKAKLSRNLALLEQELGVQLAYRTTRQFQLTEAGREFFQRMKSHLADIDATITALARTDEEIKGLIRITAAEDFGHHVLNPVIAEFSKLHGLIEFDLIYSNTLLDLVKLRIDVAFRIGQLKDSSILHKKIGRIDFIAVSSPEYLEKAERLAQPDDLINHRIIGFSGSTKTKSVWKMSSQSGAKSLTLHPQILANSFVTVRDLARLGRGIAFMPRFLAQPLIESGELIHVLRSWSGEGQPVQIGMPAQKSVPNRIRRFVDFAAKRLEQVF